MQQIQHFTSKQAKLVSGLQWIHESKTPPIVSEPYIVFRSIYRVKLCPDTHTHHLLKIESWKSKIDEHHIFGDGGDIQATEPSETYEILH